MGIRWRYEFQYRVFEFHAHLYLNFMRIIENSVLCRTSMPRHTAPLFAVAFAAASTIFALCVVLHTE